MDRGRITSSRRVSGLGVRGYLHQSRRVGKGRAHEVERRIKTPQPVVLKLRPGKVETSPWGTIRTAPKASESKASLPASNNLNSEEKSPIRLQLEEKKQSPHQNHLALEKKEAPQQTLPSSPPIAKGGNIYPRLQASVRQKQPASEKKQPPQITETALSQTPTVGYIYPTWKGMKFHKKSKPKTKKRNVQEFNIDYNPEGVTETPPDSPSSSVSDGEAVCWRSMVNHEWMEDDISNGWDNAPSDRSFTGSEFSDYIYDSVDLNPNQLDLQEEGEPLNPNPNETFSTCSLPLNNPNINPFAEISSARSLEVR